MDIVEQLMESTRQCRALDRTDLLTAAAQEILALRKDLSIAKTAIEHLQGSVADERRP
jgi:hypothetical protein